MHQLISVLSKELIKGQENQHLRHVVSALTIATQTISEALNQEFHY